MNANHEAAADAAHRKMQAERTLEPEALTSNWYAPIRQANRASSDREADRQHAIGAAGRHSESIAGYYGPTL